VARKSYWAPWGPIGDLDATIGKAIEEVINEDIKQDASQGASLSHAMQQLK